jgi:hypothetical protein
MAQVSQETLRSSYERVYGKDTIRESIDSDLLQPAFQTVNVGDENLLIQWLGLKGTLYLKEALFSNCAKGVYRLESEGDLLKIAGSKDAIGMFMRAFHQRHTESSNYHMRGVDKSDHIEVLFGTPLHETSLHILLSLMQRALVEEVLPILPIGKNRIEFRAYFQARNTDSPSFELMLAKKSSSSVVGNVSSGGTYVDGKAALEDLTCTFDLSASDIIELAIAQATEAAACYVGTGLGRTMALQIPEAPIIEQGLRDFAVDFVPLDPKLTSSHFGLIEVQPLPDLDTPLKLFPSSVSRLFSNRKTLENQARLSCMANRLS